MKKSTHLLIATILAGCITSCSSGKRIAQHRIVTNPMNLNYRFQPKDESRREAADPVLEYFKGYYYLFASKSGGYWRSEDLPTGNIFLVRLSPHWKIMLLPFFR